MKHKKKWLSIGLLLVFVVLIRVYSADELRVEQGYSSGIYPGLVLVLRLLFGWLPFSIGDLLYGLFGIWILWKLVKGIKMLYKKQVSWKGFAIRCFKILTLFLVIYIVFNGLWGINYNRKGIAYQLGLKMDK